ncbi:hypothetical protein DZB84_02870 [Bacillus sp. HNG]|uniref:hypothetical protein n=1 Tax=Bacillus sp. HNG TaxID=2293325 RepID=UPI000E2F1625|nr:hypothetical protein [Bacillus sp. HNG]RFB19215.1 hypothetical protein DZB84_02870 [Bacillus sp. HNG]
MRVYVIGLIQVLIWSTFSLVTWLSGSDSLLARGVLLIIFCYIAFVIATKIGLTRKGSLLITAISFFCFFSFEKVFWFLT